MSDEEAQILKSVLCNLLIVLWIMKKSPFDLDLASNAEPSGGTLSRRGEYHDQRRFRCAPT
jgi:hypothetical protein